MDDENGVGHSKRFKPATVQDEIEELESDVAEARAAHDELKALQARLAALTEKNSQKLTPSGRGLIMKFIY